MVPREKIRLLNSKKFFNTESQSLVKDIAQARNPRNQMEMKLKTKNK